MVLIIIKIEKFEGARSSSPVEVLGSADRHDFLKFSMTADILSYNLSIISNNNVICCYY